MGKLTAGRVLLEHFFRRFFDNDTVRGEGETLTTVVRAIAIVAAPPLTVAFFLQNQYPQRSLWGSIEDQYFFVLFSFVAMGLVAVFEWEMLFPDRLDFLILSPLPVQPARLFAAKIGALAIFLLLFLGASNVAGALTLPLVTKGPFFHHLYAHSVAVLLAGLCAALTVLALGSLLLCVLSARQFRVVSPVLQTVAVAALVGLVMEYGKVGDSMQAFVGDGGGEIGRLARWSPPMWFLGVYEQLLHGAQAPEFARPMATLGLRVTALAAAVVLVTYPMAWGRMRRMTLEGGGSKGRGAWLSTARLAGLLAKRPGERAMAAFIGQTMVRNSRYHVFLAMYCGTGLALAGACAVTCRMEAGGLRWGLAERGMHAVMPLMLFWVVSGLRTAFALPVNLPAGWVFRVTGVDIRECATAARRWAMVCAVGAMAVVLAALLAAGWGGRPLLVQLICGVVLCPLLTDGFFFSQYGVPFNTPRRPERSSLPLLLTMYIGVLPVFLYGVVWLEVAMESSFGTMARVVGVALVVHGLAVLLRERLGGVDDEMEGYEGEFQLLGLSVQ